MVNVHDISDDKIPQNVEKFRAIYNRQRELMSKYDQIEVANGFNVIPWPVNLDDRFGQFRLKDFAWRVTEEITEATKAKVEHGADYTHYHEELSDACHFLIELNILANLHPDLMLEYLEEHIGTLVVDEHWYSTVYDMLDLIYYLSIDNLMVKLANQRGDDFYAYRTIEFLGTAMNCLKQKPWKQTHMATDKSQFYKELSMANGFFFCLCNKAGLSSVDIFNMYFKKSEVNKFRQNSGY